MDCQSEEAQSTDSDAGKEDENKITVPRKILPELSSRKITFPRKILPEPCEQKITTTYVIVDAEEHARITGATEALEPDIDDLFGCVLYIGKNK